jgi:hypothetical protein
MTITIPQWPFLVLSYAGLLLVFIGMVFFTVRMTIYVMKSKNLFRMARIYLTCEKWRKEADTYVYDVLEDCMRNMRKDQPENFYYMRLRLLELHKKELTHEDMAVEIYNVSEMAGKANMMPLAETLARMGKEVFDGE